MLKQRKACLQMNLLGNIAEIKKQKNWTPINIYIYIYMSVRIHSTALNAAP